MGQVRIPVTIDKAEEAIRELRSIIRGLKDVGDSGKKTADSLSEIQKAFTPMRRSMELVSNLRSALGMLSSAATTAVNAIKAMVERVPMASREMDRMTSAADNLFTQFSEGFVVSTNLTQSIRQLGDVCDTSGGEARRLGTALGTVWEVAGPLLSILPSLSAIAQGVTARTTYSGVPDLDIIPIENTAGPDRGPTSIAVADEERRVAAIERAERRRAALAAGQALRESNMRSRGGGGGTRDFFSEAGASGGAAGAQLGIEEAIADQYRMQTEALREQLHLMDLRNAAAEFQQSLASASFDAQRQAFEKHMDDQKRLLEIEQEIADQREEQVSTYLGQVGAIASATQNLGKTVASAYEAMGGSSEKAKKAEGAFVVAYSSVMAALELAESIRAFAKQDYVSGALHLIGMAAYIAAAVEAGSQLGGGAAKTPSAQTSYTPARTEGLAAESGEQKGNTIVNQYSWGRSRAEAAVAVADIEYEGARTGRVRGADAGVWGA
jgi:hypothetical protein